MEGGSAIWRGAQQYGGRLVKMERSKARWKKLSAQKRLCREVVSILYMKWQNDRQNTVSPRSGAW